MVEVAKLHFEQHTSTAPREHLEPVGRNYNMYANANQDCA